MVHQQGAVAALDKVRLYNRSLARERIAFAMHVDGPVRGRTSRTDAPPKSRTARAPAAKRAPS